MVQVVIHTKLALVVLVLCIVTVPVAAAEPVGAPVSEPTDGSQPSECLYVDASQTPPATYWAPC